MPEARSPMSAKSNTTNSGNDARRKQESAMARVGLLYGLPFESSEIKMPVATPTQQSLIMACFFVVFTILSTSPVWMYWMTSDSHITSIVSFAAYVFTGLFTGNFHHSIPNLYRVLTEGGRENWEPCSQSKESCDVSSEIQASDTEDTLSASDDDSVASDELEGSGSPKAVAPPSNIRQIVCKRPDLTGDNNDNKVNFTTDVDSVSSAELSDNDIRHLVCIRTYL